MWKTLLIQSHVEIDLMEVYRPQNLNVDLLAYSPLAEGALTGKYTNPAYIAKV